MKNLYKIISILSITCIFLMYHMHLTVISELRDTQLELQIDNQSLKDALDASENTVNELKDELDSIK